MVFFRKKYHTFAVHNLSMNDMATSVNKVILLGYVGKDPLIRYIDKGVCVASFTLATTERAYSLPNGTEVPEHTDWHNILLWRQLGEVAEKYVHKGDLVYVEGRIKTRNYTDKKGQTQYITEIWGDRLELFPTGRKETIE